MNGQSHTPNFPTALPTPPIDPADPRGSGNPSWPIQQPQGPGRVDPQVQEQLQRFHFDNDQSAILRNAPGSMAQQGGGGAGAQQQPQHHFGLMGQQSGPNVGGPPQQPYQVPGTANPLQQHMNGGQQGSVTPANAPYNSAAPQNQQEIRQLPGSANQGQGMNAGQPGPGPHIQMPFNPGAPQNQQQGQQIPGNANPAQQQAQQAAQHALMGQPSPFAAFPPNEGTSGQPNGQQQNIPILGMPQVPPTMGQPRGAQGNTNAAANMPPVQRQTNNVFGNRDTPDSRGSIGPMSPISPMSGAPPLPIPGPTNQTQQPNAVPGGPNQADIAAAVALFMQNRIQTQDMGQQNPPPTPGAFGGLPPQVNPLQMAQIPRTARPDPAVQLRVNLQLGTPPLSRLNLPFYPAPPDIAAMNQQGEGDNLHNTRLTLLSQRLYEWTHLFEGPTIKQLSANDQNLIRGCLTIFSPLEPGLINALNRDLLSIEGLYFTPSHRRLLAQHIIALNIQVFIYYPFYPGIDRDVGNALVSITDLLYSDRTSVYPPEI